jgi:glycosyltransferase involved in cell wall biosynthesis
MKIILTSNQYYPSVGGIETVSHILARFLADKGHSVIVVTQTRLDCKFERSVDRGIQIIRNPNPFVLLNLTTKTDIIIQNNIELRTLWPSLLLQKPLLIVLQTWIRGVNGNIRLIDQLKRLVLQFADYVVAISKAFRAVSFDQALVI